MLQAISVYTNGFELRKLILSAEYFKFVKFLTILAQKGKRLARFQKNSQFNRNTMLLLTDNEVHTAKYSDYSFEVGTERNEVRTRN